MSDFMLKYELIEAKMKTKEKQQVAGNLIDWLKDTLDCSQHTVARLMGVDPHTLSNNRETPVTDLMPRTRAHLINLVAVIQHIGALRTDALLDILQRHVFADETGRMDSVVSSIQQDKYSFDVLKEIAEMAREEYHEQFIATSPDVSSALYA